MTEMEKRVGRAIWLKLSGPELDECEEAARAAIEAMREPTAGMKKLMAASDVDWLPDFWDAMIDAALWKKPE